MAGDKCFALGDYSFRLTNYPDHLKAEVELLFPTACQESDCDLLDLSSEEYGDVRAIINRALRHHSDCIWLAAATIISPEGKVALLAGVAHSGKTSLAAALALTHGWKIVSEDITLIDRKNNQIVAFAAPMSFKPGAVERLEQSIGQALAQPLLLGQWLSLCDFRSEQNWAAKFDLALYLEPLAPDDQSELSARKVDAPQMLQKLMRVGNILHLPGAPEQVMTYLKDCRCAVFKGGNLNERLDWLIELCLNAR